jgi:Iap family predicted aminopeptidase
MTDMDSIVAGVSGAEMMGNLRQIARWVKLSGTEEELEGIRFIEGRMREYGFRTAMLMHDAYISLPGAASVTVDGRALACITHSFSRVTGPEGISGVPVYLGEGTDVDFAGRDVRGRVVLLEGMATPWVAARATRAGAIGQLHISHHEHLHEMCISPVWGNPAPETFSQLPATVACTVSDADGGAIRDALAAGQQPVVTLRAAVDTRWRQTPLLVAELPATEDPQELFVMVSGHHDGWHYGVMDNGSANAGMMEIARIAAQHRRGWKRGLRLCFWSGHSHGRYSGSAWYADTHWDELERRCVAHVNVDSLGGIGATELAGAAAMAELRHLARQAVEAEVNVPYRGKRKTRNSDESFGGIGIPSMFGAVSAQPHAHGRARNHLGWWWHTPHDLIDKVDEANLVRDTRVLARALWRLLADPVVPLDTAAMAQTLATELEALAPRLRDRLPVDVLLAAARDVQARAARRQASPGSDPDAASRALMGVSRALVPLDANDGDRFGHPPALPLPDWSALEPLRVLAAAEPGTDAARLAATAAYRARNRVQHALRQALHALGT